MKSQATLLLKNQSCISIEFNERTIKRETHDNSRSYSFGSESAWQIK